MFNRKGIAGILLCVAHCNRIIMGKEYPVVSVIVPAYNVGLYLEQCVESVLVQNYKDFELIIVDDGSEDKTPELADALCVTDKRIKVLHKKNGGVSAARNAGMEIARGDYVAFLDGDDYWATDYLSYMVNMAQSTGADMCLSTICFLTDNDGQTKEEFKKVISAEEGTVLLLYPKVFVGCWNKLYSRRLLNENSIRFKENLFFGEGLNFITNASQHAKCIAVGNRKVYYYRRDNIESATTSFSIERVYNGIESLTDIEKYLYLKTTKIYHALELHNTLYRVMSINKIYASGTVNKYKCDYDAFVAYVRKHALKLVLHRSVPLKNKMMLILCSLSPRVMGALSKIRRSYGFKHSVK